MKINDSIYGEFNIDSEAIAQLISSPSIKRLKGINQFGMPDEYYFKKGFTRYDHSVGVMLLLLHLGASEEEQIAGLLHDVSHTAFSHVYDWVMDDYTKHGNVEDRQDHVHDQYINNSELPEILVKYGYTVERITDYHHFGLLERDSPDLCADRVDYSIKELDADLGKRIYGGLINFENQIVCRDLETAALFGREYMKIQNEHFSGYESTARYYILSKLLKRAMKLGIISSEDFWQNDEYMINKLKESNDMEVANALQLLRQNALPVVTEGIRVYKKFRFVDPPFLKDGKLIKLSSVDPEYKDLLAKSEEQNKVGMIVPNS